MSLLSVDLRFRGHEYRLAEPPRSEGASVRPAGSHFGCLICPRRFHPQTNCVCLPDGTGPLCIPDAIRVGALIHMPRCQEQDDIDAALNARTDDEAVETEGAARRS